MLFLQEESELFVGDRINGTFEQRERMVGRSMEG